MRTETKIDGRVYLRVDLADIEPDDVVEYMSDDNRVGISQARPIPHRRCHRVNGVRRGKQPAVRIELHEGEPVARLWYPLEWVIRAWRRRTELKRRPRVRA